MKLLLLYIRGTDVKLRQAMTKISPQLVRRRDIETASIGYCSKTSQDLIKKPLRPLPHRKHYYSLSTSHPILCSCSHSLNPTCSTNSYCYTDAILSRGRDNPVEAYVDFIMYLHVHQGMPSVTHTQDTLLEGSHTQPSPQCRAPPILGILVCRNLPPTNACYYG